MDKKEVFYIVIDRNSSWENSIISVHMNEAQALKGYQDYIDYRKKLGTPFGYVGEWDEKCCSVVKKTNGGRAEKIKNYWGDFPLDCNKSSTIMARDGGESNG
jgi:hypothetical protein